MSEYLLQMLNISKTFPGVKALDDVKLEVKKGKFMPLLEKTAPVNPHSLKY